MEAPRSYDAAIHPEDVFDVTLWSPEDSWTVQTPAIVRGLYVTDEDAQSMGLEFVNLGNLYGQVADVLGRYFNRRALRRVRPALEEPVTASLSSHGHRMPGTVIDLTPLGVGLLVDHVLAVTLRIDADARLTLHLPGCEQELTGVAYIRQRRRLRDRNVIGLELEAADTFGFPAHAELIRQYCAERERELSELDADIDRAA